MGAVLAGFGGMLFQQERRLHPARRPAGPLGAVLAGAGLRHRLDAVRRARRSPRSSRWPAAPAMRSTARILLAVYSLGLGVPFLLSGLLFTRGLASFASLRRHTPLLSAPRGSS